MVQPERYEIKFYDCPYCKTKQPVGYVWEYQLSFKHICGSCQIGNLTPREINKLISL